MIGNKREAVLSINNYDAGYAAVAKYPALAEPMGLALSSPRFKKKPLDLGYAYEALPRVPASAAGRRKEPQGNS